MRTVTPRFQVKRRNGTFKYTVFDNDRNEPCGTMGWPEENLYGVSHYASFLNEAYKFVPRAASGVSEENFEET
jgi:hypothetical protein